MSRLLDCRCRLCNRNVFECGGWLERVNEKGVLPIIVECRPHCLSELPDDQKVLGAIEGSENTRADDLDAGITWAPI